MYVELVHLSVDSNNYPSAAMAASGPHVLAQCHCGAFKQTLALARPLPNDSVLCHCDICRSTSGALYHSSLALLTSPSALSPLVAGAETLAKFNASEKIARYFCTVCGSHVLIWHDRDVDAWKV